MWLRDHKEKIEKERSYPTKEKPYKKKGDGVLKVPTGWPQSVNSVDSDDAKEIVIVQSINFEDTLYKKEKKEVTLTPEQFITYL